MAELFLDREGLWRLAWYDEETTPKDPISTQLSGPSSIGSEVKLGMKSSGC